MSTRSTISVYIPLDYPEPIPGGVDIFGQPLVGTHAFLIPGMYPTVYVHFDGYPDHHLPILTEHYNTLDKAIQLIKPGDISVLDKDCSGGPHGPGIIPHSFDNKRDGQTVYYGRDRHDPWDRIKPRVFPFWPDRDAFDCDQEYSYLFKDGVWTYRDAYSQYSMEELEDGDYIRDERAKYAEWLYKPAEQE